jgi:hypothetical protein
MDFDMKNMTTYLGCITLALFVAYLCTNMFSLNNKIVEGLISKKKKTLTPDEVLTEVEKLKETMVDGLNIEKYAPTYKKILVSLEDTLHLKMLQTIMDAENVLMDETQWIRMAQTIKTLQGGVESLSTLDEFLTHNKPKSGGSWM